MELTGICLPGGLLLPSSFPERQTFTMIRRSLCVFLMATLAMAIALLGFARPAVAATRDTSAPGHATIIVLDMSGSMAQNDPLGLRCSAANAYIDLSGSNPNEAANYVGLIGLDNDNATGPSEPIHGFRAAAIWAPPTATNVTANRQQLRDIIAQRSNNCAPHGNTPTFDALNKAFTMLDSFLQGKNLSGSVILLTDGNPDPQGDQQVSATNKEIIPQYALKKYPIDTIALGTDRSYRDFLTTISKNTGGTAYDDTQGPVQGVSPLNLERVFVDIFLQYEGRKLRTTIPPSAIQGGQSNPEFTIGDDVTHLDVIAVKDQPNTTISLTDPNGQIFHPESEGNFISQDPHYFIFALEAQAGATALQSGPWKLNLNGSGMFLMDTLVVSPLSLNILAPVDGKTLPIGQPVTITASVVNQGTIVVNKTYALTARVTPDAGGGSQEVILNPTGSGLYSGTFMRTLDKDPTGSYTITISAVADTRPVTDAASIHVKFALYPTAALIDPVTQQPQLPTAPANCTPSDTTPCLPTAKPVTANYATWDPFMTFVYTRVPGFASKIGAFRPRDWPLHPYTLDPTTQITGVVLVGTGASAKAYPGAQVMATLTPLKADGTPAGPAFTVPAVMQADGHFTIPLPKGAKGTYNVSLTTTGNQSDAFGDPVTSTTSLKVGVGSVPRDAVNRAYLITGLYLLLVILFAYLVLFGPLNYLIRPKPNGRSRLVDTAVAPGGKIDPNYPLKWRSASLGRYLAPNKLPAGQASLPNNAAFDFGYGRIVNLRVHRARAKTPDALWRINGRVVTHNDGAEALVPGMLISITEGGQTHEYRFDQLSNKGMQLAASKRQNAKAAKTPKAAKPVQPPKAPPPPKGPATGGKGTTP